MMVIAIIAILAALLLPVLVGTQEKARVARCKQNLRQLGAAMQLYANRYGGYYPMAGLPPYEDDLSALYPEFIDELRLFVCPSSVAEVNGAQDLTDNVGGLLGKTGMGYEYRPFYSYIDGCVRKHQFNTSEMASQVPMIHDADELGQPGVIDAMDNHGLSGVNVLYADWHVAWVAPGEQAEKVSAKDCFDTPTPGTAVALGGHTSLPSGDHAGTGGDYPVIGGDDGSHDGTPPPCGGGDHPEDPSVGQPGGGHCGGGDDGSHDGTPPPCGGGDHPENPSVGEPGDGPCGGDQPDKPGEPPHEKTPKGEHPKGEPTIDRPDSPSEPVPPGDGAVGGDTPPPVCPRGDHPKGDQPEKPTIENPPCPHGPGDKPTDQPVGTDEPKPVCPRGDHPKGDHPENPTIENPTCPHGGE
jgi:prepilin-type processing-associated H-X9-DG protein